MNAKEWSNHVRFIVALIKYVYAEMDMLLLFSLGTFTVVWTDIGPAYRRLMIVTMGRMEGLGRCQAVKFDRYEMELRKKRKRPNDFKPAK